MLHLVHTTDAVRYTRSMLYQRLAVRCIGDATLAVAVSQLRTLAVAVSQLRATVHA